MQWQLIIDQGKQKGRVIPIAQACFMIGRDRDCQLRPAADSVSRRHCILTVRDSSLYVADCRSSNGTFVNDRRLEDERELHPSDCLKVGPMTFVVGVATSIAPGEVAARRAGNNMDEETVAQMLLAMDDSAG